ncbi:hypothetical protein L2E82_45147 [Cichorium intybus]|uniref:Uncharacterized protein n=1 Tax=Cichorium intybus TaxID=13427 RepID=A0ACB8ZSQ7_CICIN|nr:hypothetical protein L2E82_45147 [Cichorium intybus]
MENGNLEMPCKIRKRRFPTTSSSSFANNKLSQFLVEKTGSPENEKCINRSTCKPDEPGIMTLQKSGSDYRVNEMYEKSITNVDRSRNPSRVSAPEVINPRYGHPCSFMEKDKSFGGMPLICDAKPDEGTSRPSAKNETEINNYEHSLPKPTNNLDEIKHSLTISKQLLKLLTHIWTTNTNHNHPTSLSLASTLNHELNKARSHINKLIQEQKTTHESNEQDKVRLAVKTITRELETEKKLRKQTERMNKKLGRELASTKASLANAIKKSESEKQATEILEELCEKMARSIEKDRVELEELKEESERVREEIEEEREMLRVADMLREERLQMKLIDAKYEYENKHEQMNVLVHDLEQLLEGGERESTHLLWCKREENNKGKVVNDENALEEGSNGLSWYENLEGEVVNDEMGDMRNEVIGRNSDCIELEFGLDMKHGSEELNEFSEERVLGFSCSSNMKEYEDEMERYKMIKDLRDRIVSGSDLSRDTLGSESYL